MTRGSLGFGNWLAAVVCGEKPRMGTDFLRFTVGGVMPDHPSPKPISYMLKLVERVTEQGDLVLDPFCGSGTTGVACMMLGRRFLGIELDEGYAAMARRRIAGWRHKPRRTRPQAPPDGQAALFDERSDLTEVVS